MSAFYIKLIAIVIMIIDHLGLFFFPHIFLLRIIGRLAFPLFAWLIANGAHHTRNMNAYLGRTFFFALLSQLPFFFANRMVYPSFYGLNVIFTLFMGLLTIKIIQKNKVYFSILMIFISTILGYIFQTDYAGLGVLSIVLFYFFFGKVKSTIISQVILFMSLPFILIAIGPNRGVFANYFNPFFELCGLFSLFFISSYNGKEGTKLKYFFYAFYPIQYLIIIVFRFLL